MANMRFRLGFLPFLGYHHILQMILLVAIVLFGLVLASCTSSNMSNIYLTSLSYDRVEPKLLAGDVNHNLSAIFRDIVNGSSLHVRTGYWGLCVSKAGDVWQCDNDVNKLSPLYHLPDDPLNLIAVSADCKNGIFFPGFLIAAEALAAISILALSTVPGWHEEVDENGSERDVKPFPNRRTTGIGFASSAVAAALGLMSMVWQHTASVAAATTAQNMAYGAVRSEVGVSIMAFGWVGLICLMISAVGQLIMILSIRILDKLTG